MNHGTELETKDYGLFALGAVIVGAILFKPRKAYGMSQDDDARLHLPQYPPDSPEAVHLFEVAATNLGVPLTWAASGSPLHKILGRESQGGWVGIPNYQFGLGVSRRAEWPNVWGWVKDGTWREHLAEPYISYYKGRLAPPPTWKGPSSATGLGQLTGGNPNNILTYVPGGFDGMGDPLSEATGMLAYIRAKYGSPDVAWARYGARAGAGHEGY